MAGLLQGDVEIPHVGKFPKAAVVIGVGGVIALIVWQNHKSKSAAASPTATATADPYPPDGTVGDPSDPNSTDPSTGMTYGDEAAGYTGSGALPYGGTGGTAGTISSSTAYPWDGTYNNPNDPYSLDSSTGNTYGNEGYTGTGPGGGTTPTGPPFSTNSQWSQYVLSYFSTNQYSDIAGRTDAIGLYLSGATVTQQQAQYIQDAIAIGGPPPVAAASGFPPSIKTSGSTTTTGTVTVPKVTGMTATNAVSALRAVGLIAGSEGKNGGSAIVNSQTPGAGKKVTPGSTVDLGLAQSGQSGGNPPSASIVTVPRVDGLKVGPAHNDIVRAGLVVANRPNSNWVVHSTSPAGGAKVARGTRVTINAAP